MTDPRLEALLELLRSNGGRVTTPRRIILSALLASDGHITADELTTEIQHRHPSIHESTVYRTLETLTELGVVDHVHLGHGRAVWHLADERHQHLLCTDCGAVTEISDRALTSLRQRLDREHGFRLDPRHFALTGTCERCHRAAR